MAEPIARIFLGWDRPALASAADLLADHYLQAGEVRMDGAVLALPGARPGRRVKELLLEEAERRGARLVPPRVVRIGALPELLYQPPAPPAWPVLCRLLWARSLRTLAPARLAGVFPDRPADGDLAGWVELARDVAGLHREVAGAGMRFADVAARLGSGLVPADDGGAPRLAFDDADRWAALAEAQVAYEAALDAMGCVDPELARLDAAAAGAVACDRDVWLIGVAEMPVVTRRLLRAVAALGAPVRALVQAPAERAGEFDAEGCVLPGPWSAAEVALRDDQLSVRDRPADQADEALRVLAALDGAWAADQISVGVPDPEVVPFLERALAGAGLPVRHAAGRPADRTGPFRLLAAVAGHLADARFETLAALLRHPDVTAWARRAGPAAPEPAAEARAAAAIPSAAPAAHASAPDAWLEAADAYHAERLPYRIAGPLPGAGRARDRVESARVVLDSLLSGFRPVRDGADGRRHEDGQPDARRRLAEWAPVVLDLLARVYGGVALDRDDPGVRRLVAACERLRDAAAGYHGLPEQADERCAAATAIRLILADAAGEAIPPDPDRAAIELLGWLELHLDDAPVKVITGFNEPYLPESVNADVFLPDSLRRHLGLTDNQRRRARDGYVLAAMLHATPVVRVIAGRRSGTGDPLRPSRLMLALRGRALAERIRRFYGAAAPAAAQAGPVPAPPAGQPGLAHEAAAAAGSRFVLPPERVIRAQAPIREVAVTAFRTLLRDPYLYALERLLRLAPLDDAARELDGAAFGDLAHAVLLAFGAAPEVDAGDARAATRRLDRILDRTAAARYGRDPLPAVRIQLEQLRARLHAFARWHAAWIADGWRVAAVEGRVRWPGAAAAGPRARRPDDDIVATLAVPFPVDGEVFTIRGRIDRVDYHPGRNEWAVFDYKTADAGAGPEETHRRASTKEWIDLQLPLYRHLLADLRAAGGEPLVPAGATDRVRLGYILLPRELDRTGPAWSAWTAAELAGADEEARRALRFLAGGVFEHDPDAAARYDGPLAALLGRGHLTALADGEDADAGDEGDA